MNELVNPPIKNLGENPHSWRIADVETHRLGQRKLHAHDTEAEGNPDVDSFAVGLRAKPGRMPWS